MKFRCLLIAASVAAISINSACKKVDDDAAPATVAASDGSAWGTHIETFLDGYFKLAPTTAVYQGKHEFDGQLPDWSPEGLTAMIDYRKKAIADAKAVDDGDMTDAEKFERDYLVHAMEGELFGLEDA